MSYSGTYSVYLPSPYQWAFWFLSIPWLLHSLALTLSSSWQWWHSQWRQTDREASWWSFSFQRVSVRPVAEPVFLSSRAVCSQRPEGMVWVYQSKASCGSHEAVLYAPSYGHHRCKPSQAMGSWCACVCACVSVRFRTNFLVFMNRLRDLWCSSTVRLLSTQTWVNHLC